MRVERHIDRVVQDLIDVGTRAGTLPELDASSRTALAVQITDAFDNGKFEVGLQHLIARAPDTRSAEHLQTLGESALHMLGVDPTTAKRSWKQAFFKLGTTPSYGSVTPRLSPARDAFRGIRMGLSDRVTRNMRRISAAQLRLQRSIDQAVASDDPVGALNTLVSKIDLATTGDSGLMSLLEQYAEFGAWQQILDVYEACPPDFQEYPRARRASALANLQLGKPNEALTKLSEIADSGKATNVTYGILGHVYLKLSEDAKTSEESQAFLSKAIDAYKTGFDADRAELYPAVALPPLLEVAGRSAEAKKMAEVVLTIAKGRASYGDRHFWDHAGIVSLSLITGDHAEVEKNLKTLESCKSSGWMRNSACKLLERMATAKAARGEDVSAIRAAASRIRNMSDVEQSAPARDRADRNLQALLDHAYRFGGRSAKRLGGNYHVQGIAHDMRVTSPDVRYFTRILEAAGLDRISNPVEASKAMDAVIRNHFGTEALEVMTSDEHKRFDMLMPALAKYMGASAHNSQTNVSADWVNKLADCRQHAPVKLMLFEAWKRTKLRGLNKAIDRAHKTGDASKVAQLERKLRSLLTWEMRILDANVVRADNGEKIEEHTMTLLIKRKTPDELGDEMTGLGSVHLADSFYHGIHALGEGQVKLRFEGDKMKIDVPKPSADGTKIVLEPAPYSFDRSVPSVDYGQLAFRGIRVASPGWEEEIPVDGVDLGYLHDYVEIRTQKAGKPL